MAKIKFSAKPKYRGKVTRGPGGTRKKPRTSSIVWQPPTKKNTPADREEIATKFIRNGKRSSAGKEYEMVLYQLDYILHEPREDQGWLYMAEIPDLPGCRAWAESANAALVELSVVAEQFIISYKERGDPMPAAIARSLNGQGRISVAV